MCVSLHVNHGCACTSENVKSMKFVNNSHKKNTLDFCFGFGILYVWVVICGKLVSHSVFVALF